MTRSTPWLGSCAAGSASPLRSAGCPEAILETLEAVDTFEPDDQLAMRDPNSAGPAMGLVKAMQEAGVDRTDKRAVNA